mgnify:CR=1 FL=1|tara:strand:- start:144078 stop:146108 length:2031 start_codon:yes stop_codon:yes gene_type:complete
MQLLKFVPIKLTLFLVLGIIVGNYVNVSITLPLLLTIISLIFLGVLFKTKRFKESIYFGINTLILTFSIGFLVVTFANPKNTSNYYGKFTFEEPHELHLKIEAVLKSNTFSDRYIATVFKVNNVEATGKILLTIPLDTNAKKIKVDDELMVFSKLSQVHSPLNPHEFNYKKYLESLGIYHQLNLRSNSDFILNKNPTKTTYGIAASWRESIIYNLKKEKFGVDELAIIQALILGQRNDITEEIYMNYKNAGAIHILAVSGLHIGVLLFLLQFLLQPIEMLPFGKKIKLVLIIGILWSFAFLAGLSASIVRAVTMFSFFAYAEYLNRSTNRFNILALSIFFILLIKPTYLFQVGFQLSYAAVFAILWMYPMLQRFWFPKNIVVRKIWQLLCVSITAQLGVLPISLFYFHQFPSLFFISNLIIVPCLGLLLGGGILISILSLFGILPNFMTQFYNTIIRFMNMIIEWIAHQETFIFKDIPFNNIQLVLGYIIIVSFVFAITKSSFKKASFFLYSIISFQLWSFYASYKASSEEQIFIIHQSKNSGLFYKKGTDLHILSNQPKRLTQLISNYKVEERSKNIIQDSLKNSYIINNECLYILDSLHVYPPKNSRITYLLLTQSPKINLEKFLDSVKPKLLIADGSNYKNDIINWQETCRKRKLPFHYTGEKGAFYFNLKDE